MADSQRALDCPGESDVVIVCDGVYVAIAGGSLRQLETAYPIVVWYIVIKTEFDSVKTLYNL